MRVGLFIPCYVDQFYPSVGIATLELLEKSGVEVLYPEGQTCCGQPMANAGFEHLTGGCASLFDRHFSDVDYVVCPSGSCTLHVREHLQASSGRKTFELTEFLTDVLKIKKLNARFPYKVGLHQSCHGQRGLHLSSMSERVETYYSKPEQLLKMVEGLQLTDLKRADECCGFGGTFCVTEEAVSARMGQDRVEDHRQHGAEFITSADMSCLMHLDGILRRQKNPVKVRHIAEILNGSAI